MSQTQEFSQFTIEHQLKRRIRIIAPSLFRDKERAYILQILLLKREAIEKVKIVSDINSVTIHYSPEQLPQQNLLNLLETVLANFSQKPRESIKEIVDKTPQKKGKELEVVFGVGGMSCASCALFLEMILSRNADNLKVSINYVSETGVISGYLSKAEIFKIIEDNGYQAYSIDTLEERKLLLQHEQQHLLAAKKKLSLIALMSIPVVLVGLAPVKSSRLRIIQALFSVPIVLWGGKDVFKKSMIQMRQGVVNMDSMIAIGSGSALAVSIPSIFDIRRHAYFDAASAIIVFVQLGRYLEELAKSKMVREVEALVNMQPKTATLLKDEVEIQIESDVIQVDDILLIRPGDRVPVDGIVISGLSRVDELMATGSNKLCIKEKGHKIFDGSINGSGVLTVKATAVGKDTKLAELVRMIDQSRSSKLHIQKTVDVISSYLMPAIIFFSSATFFLWLAKGERVAHAFSNAISVLLISCPCALGLATPAATTVSSGQAAKRKIYIRNGNALEILASVDTFIFDKTGTLTEGNVKITGFHNVSEFDDEYLLQLAASAEFNSEHLYARAIVDYVKDKDILILKSSKFYSVPEQGIRCKVDGHELLLGNEKWLNEQKIDLFKLKNIADEWTLESHTLVYIAVDNSVLGLFALTDKIRKGSKQLVHKLHEQNIETFMLTGDVEASARAIADLAGIKLIMSEASPSKKIQFIRDLQSKGKVVAMVGDGINDAPALAAADVSLVIGRASGVAIEAADLILVDDDIAKVDEILEISKQTLVVVKQNIFWAFAYNTVVIPIAMAGKLNPMASSAAMALSSLSVIANSLRLNKK